MKREKFVDVVLEIVGDNVSEQKGQDIINYKGFVADLNKVSFEVCREDTLLKLAVVRLLEDFDNNSGDIPDLDFVGHISYMRELIWPNGNKNGGTKEK